MLASANISSLWVGGRRTQRWKRKALKFLEEKFDCCLTKPSLSKREYIFTRPPFPSALGLQPYYHRGDNSIDTALSLDKLLDFLKPEHSKHHESKL